jgi:hypothetical protein
MRRPLIVPVTPTFWSSSLLWTFWSSSLLRLYGARTRFSQGSRGGEQLAQYGRRVRTFHCRLLLLAFLDLLLVLLDLLRYPGDGCGDDEDSE